MTFFELLKEYGIKGLITLAFSGLTACIVSISSKLKKQKYQQDSLKMGMQAMLRDRIVDAYYKAIDRGYMPIYMMENVNQLYEQYHNLGGNSFVTHLIEEMMDMPKVKPNK